MIDDIFLLTLQSQSATWKHTLLFSFQSLGVLFGQLSSAPLYVFGTIPSKDFESEETPYGLFSFIFWTMTIISLLKYALIVLRADDDGEGTNHACFLSSNYENYSERLVSNDYLL